MGVLCILLFPIQANCEATQRSARSGIQYLAHGHGQLSAGFERYKIQQQRFSQTALENGYAAYASAVAVLYPNGVIDEAVLDAKRRWRRETAKEFAYAADYESLEVPVTVRTLAARDEPALGSTLVACYEANYHVVRISSQASDAAVLHEAGHALQRQALLQRTFAQSSFVSASYEPHAQGSGGKDFLANSVRRAERRLEYLSSQDEFEVRLQDLNRFYAVWSQGRPIMDPVETLKALLALGMPLRYEHVSEAIDGSDFLLGESDFSVIASETKTVSAAEREIFEDAAELLLLQELVFEIDRTLWPLCLRKILFESPGHL